MRIIDDTFIIGIDSGYGNIKTANCCFPASVAAFVNTALGMLLSCNPKDPDNKRSLSCNVSDSSDGQNHFWLLKRK